MDRNKRAKLEEIRYVIRPCCELCCFSDFSFDGFGQCVEHEYKHCKHQPNAKPISIHRSGYCSKFLTSASNVGKLRAFADFYQHPDKG